jgi:hypothetical protein
MAHPPLTRRIARGARALAASAYILLAIAAAAQARPADTWPQPVVHNSPAPTVVKPTLLPPASSGPDTITLLLIGIAAGAALLGAGYLGARIATRTSRVPLTTTAGAKSSTPTHSGPASRTGI